MTIKAPDQPVSRARFERERRARIEAETLLESKATELFDANSQLLSEREALSFALNETERMRAREEAALREQSVLFHSLEALSGKTATEDALKGLLSVLSNAFEGADAFFLQTDGSDQVRIVEASLDEKSGRPLPVVSHLIDKPRVIAGLQAFGKGVAFPDPFAAYTSVLVVPVETGARNAQALLLGSAQADRFSENDRALVERVAELAAQSLIALREARRNKMLISLLQGGSVPEQAEDPIASTGPVGSAFKFLSDIQGGIAGVLDGLLSSPVEGLEGAIDEALGNMLRMAKADGAYVFRPDPDGTTLHNTKAWQDPEGGRKREELENIPASEVAQWTSGAPEQPEPPLRTIDVPLAGENRDSPPSQSVELTAVPLINDGAFRGFVGFETSKDLVEILADEIKIIRSIAKVFTALLAMREQTAQIKQLAQIARRTSNFVIMTDEAKRITWMNKSLLEACGWTLDAIKGQTVGRFLYSGQNRAQEIDTLHADIQSNDLVQRELECRSRDGVEYWVAYDIQPLRNTAGYVEGYMAVGTNITERRLQSEALRLSADEAAKARAALEAAVEALEDGFVLFDAEDRVEICNERYRQIYARSAPAIVPGARFEDILRYGAYQGEYAEAIGREEEWVAERMRLHRASSSEVEQQLSDGRWLRIFEKATPNGGRVGLRVDITAIKLAEKRALADRSAAMEASQDGIAITDEEGRFLYVNKAHLRLFGYQSDAELVGRHWSALFSPDVAAWMEMYALPDVIGKGSWSGEIMGLARDGEPVDQDVSLTSKDDGGILWIARDMRARRREAAELDRLQQELQLAQRREIVGQMAAGLAHDFNNLLATISGSAQLIRDDVPPKSLAATGVQRIQSATERASGLVKRLLSIGRNESEPVRLDLRVPLREATDLVRAGLRAPLQLQVRLPDDPVEVMADPNDVLQMVLNLAINARDAIGSGPGTISVALETGVDGAQDGPFAVGGLDAGRRYCKISVADTGSGMTPELAARVFKPYETTKGAKGSGLGLAIISSVVLQANGALRLDTAPGEGSTFTVFWPEASGAAQQDAGNTGADALTGRLDGRTVLVVDDHDAFLDIMTVFLESAGAEVAASSEPMDVIEAVRDDPDGWDIVITDYEMPPTTGLELSRQVRAIAPDIPIVLVTALDGMTGRYPDVFDAVLKKPLDKDALVFTVEAAINRAKEGQR